MKKEAQIVDKMSNQCSLCNMCIYFDKEGFHDMGSIIPCCTTDKTPIMLDDIIDYTAGCNKYRTDAVKILNNIKSDIIIHIGRLSLFDRLSFNVLEKDLSDFYFLIDFLKNQYCEASGWIEGFKLDDKNTILMQRLKEILKI